MTPASRPAADLRPSSHGRQELGLCPRVPGTPCAWRRAGPGTVPAAPELDARAVLALPGHRAWWLPRILNRVVSQADVEGEALSRHVPASATAPDAAVRRLPCRPGPSRP